MTQARRYNILMLHNAYQIRGGEEESAESECQVLRDAGHRVTYVETHNDAIASRLDVARAGLLSVWNPAWQRRVAGLLAQERFDLLHVQNTFPQISPSVYRAARNARVPVVQAVRNYRYACPAATLLRDGAPCTACVGKSVKLPGVRHACYRGSRAATATAATVSGLHHLLGTWQHSVDRYLAVSQSVADVLIQEGFPAARIRVKPCFAIQRFAATPETRRAPLSALFVGRLSEEKGLNVLLDAWQTLGREDATLRIIGDGDLPRRDLPNVTYLGRKAPAEVQRAMAEAAFVVMPGAWPEPFGRVAVEAFAQATPVISTALGGVADVVQDGISGQLVPRGDRDALARAMARYFDAPKAARAHGQAARQRYLARYAPAQNGALLEALYAEVLAEQEGHTRQTQVPRSPIKHRARH